MMESTYSCSSFSGLVSSKRRLVLPPNSAASPKLRQMDLAWPMCRYPLGSGGKRVCPLPPYLLVFTSSRMMSRMKFDSRSDDSAGGVAAASTSWLEAVMISFSVRKEPTMHRCRSSLVTGREHRWPKVLFYVVATCIRQDWAGGYRLSLNFVATTRPIHVVSAKDSAHIEVQ